MCSQTHVTLVTISELNTYFVFGFLNENKQATESGHVQGSTELRAPQTIGKNMLAEELVSTPSAASGIRVVAVLHGTIQDNLCYTLHLPIFDPYRFAPVRTYMCLTVILVADFKVRFLVASSPLCDSILVEIKCINVRRNTTVFSNC
jgi:hypothetical protein